MSLCLNLDKNQKSHTRLGNLRSGSGSGLWHQARALPTPAVRWTHLREGSRLQGWTRNSKVDRLVDVVGSLAGQIVSQSKGTKEPDAIVGWILALAEAGAYGR
jgi:hypothetical protein